MRLKNFSQSLKGKLTLLITAAILLPLLAAALIMENILQRRIQQSFKKELEVGLSSIALTLTWIEEDLAEVTNRIAEDKSLQENLSPETNPQLKKMLNSHRKVMDISLLAVFDMNQQRLASSKFKSKNLGLDFMRTDQFQVVQSEDEYYWLYVTMIQAKDNKPLGYVVSGLLLSNEKAFLAYLQELSLSHVVFWLDGNLILTDLPANELSSPPVYSPGELVDFILAKEPYKGLIRSRMLGNRQLEYAILVPLTALQEALAKLLMVLAVIVAALFAVFLAALSFIVGKITRPLNHLTNYANELSANNFAPQISAGLKGLARGSRDEVGKLAQSFIHMEQQLQTYLQHLTETTRANERIQSELRIARDIQMNMLPRRMPIVSNGKHFDISAIIEPAQEVGGDFYDYFMIDAHHLCLVIGDVSDKGVPASLFMAVSKTLLRAATTLTRTMALAGIAPEEILTRVNAELCRDNELLMFVTIFYGVLEVQSGQINYSIGGHNPPYLLSQRQGIMELDQHRGAPLGVKKNAHYDSSRVIMQPGDGLFLYTDGITEAMDDGGNLYSEQRLETFLHRVAAASADEIAKQTISEVKEFAGGAPQQDDITVLVIKYL